MLSNKKRIIHAALFTPRANRWGLPLLIWDEPGKGKSGVIESIGAACGLYTEVLSPGERGEGAFGCVPVPQTQTDGTMRLAYPAPDWTMNMPERGLVFTDEVTTAPPALQPALLGLVYAGRIGSYTLPAGVRIIGAANPPEQAAGGWDLAPPVANRYGHLDWEIEAEEWADWLIGSVDGGMGATLDPAAEEDRVMAGWSEAYAASKGLLAAFMRARPELLHKMPKAGDPKAGRAWPSPRTWEYACRAYAAASPSIHNLTETETDDFLAAFVGVGAASEFVHFAQKADLPNPADVLDGRVDFAHNPKRLDVTAAVIQSCTALVAPSTATKRIERAGKLWEILDDVSGSALDLAIPAVKVLETAGLSMDPGLRKQADKVLNRCLPALRAVGRLV